MNFLNNLNLNKNQIQNALMHPLAAAPASPKESQMYYNTVDKKLYYYDGTKWIGLNDIDLTPYATKQYVDDKFTDEIGDGVLTLQLNGTALAPTFTANQKTNSTINVQVTKSTVGLGNVDNTSDKNKPISDAQQTALDGKLDKVKTNTPTKQVYAKNADGTQGMVNVGGTADDDIATVGQVNATEPYHVKLIGTSGTLSDADFAKLDSDDNSYILLTYSGQKYKLHRTATSTTDLIYSVVDDEQEYKIILLSDYTWGLQVITLENTANRVTEIKASSADEEYPSAAATYTYGQTVLTDAKSYTDTATENVEKTTNKKTTIEGNGNATDYPSTSAVVGYAAPIAHAVAGTTYGAGTTEVYGHVKLITGDMNGKVYAAGQVPSLNHTHGQYAELAGAAFRGNVTIGGNLTVNGTTTTIESSTLQVKDKLIEVAHGNTTALTTPAGLIVPKYDGTNSGALVFDSTGTAYVGDVTLDTDGNIDVTNSDLRALAARDGTIANGNITKWDNTKQALVDAGIASSNIALKSEIPTEQDYVTIDTTQTITGAKTFDASVVLSKGLYVGDTPSAGSANQVLTSRSDGKSPEWKNVSTILPNNVVTTDDVQDITGAKTFKGEIAVDNHIRANGGVGTAGQVLTSQGANNAPSWRNIPVPSNMVTTDSAQVITGTKTFSSSAAPFPKTAISANGMTVYSSQSESTIYSTSAILRINGSTPSVISLPTKGGMIALTSEIPSNYVTTDTAQSIGAAKTFAKEVAFDNQIKANGSVGTAGQVLTSQGADKAPQWTTLIIPQGTVKKFTGLIAGNGTSTSFNITNQLSTVDCTVSVYSQVNGTTWEMVMTDVSVSVESITITFGQAVATGKNYKVVVTG